jgi:hypothetical protein
MPRPTAATNRLALHPNSLSHQGLNPYRFQLEEVGLSKKGDKKALAESLQREAQILLEQSRQVFNAALLLTDQTERAESLKVASDLADSAKAMSLQAVEEAP